MTIGHFIQIGNKFTRSHSEIEKITSKLQHKDVLEYGLRCRYISLKTVQEENQNTVITLNNSLKRTTLNER